ncbi:PRC-barrel domain-containing protein [Methylobacterium frigidaeris]|uniref:PRC-barrel domain-containing protein n=1 Tax=Methylobacterium frigidaeris TaxID=2038277 RepID=A0AA37M5Q3_9HYPH|nr:PRC-barrel domain-containing protein [Methylobacterium frigidaeris]PIK72115.1 photosystem reaction center subunit H [Methylobacterium frigidaeris]GJD63490.1 hypothetical protein MPEAHAMD_3658 [Methylobacterium frigidaeris]
MTLKTALATAALLLACGSALAQTATQPGATGAMTTQQVKTATVQFITLEPAAAVTSRILGTKVTNAQNESVGDIADLVIVDGKTVQAVILGIGERYVAVSPDSVTLVRDGDGWKATVNATKDELSKAPAFDYKKKG